MPHENKKLWGGRFGSVSAEITEKLSSSIQYDCRMYRQDIRGSIAHARMLEKMKILSADELKAVTGGLTSIMNEIERGDFPFSESLEDIHMNIESRLTERIGEAGKKLHTARSRNDQVALDVRLYIRDEAKSIREELLGLIETLVKKAEENIDVIMPGYTHMQVAQPVLFAQHMLAYAWQFTRDMRRLDFADDSSSSLPLGCGALAGVNYKNDREFLRNELGFKDIVLNSMDAVSDRDFVLDFLYFSAVMGAHMSRFCEEIVLWSGSDFSFIKLAENLTTGSSIMPQKRNPDLAELIRGKSGRLYGNLFSLLTVLKGIPMTYNRDIQEDKEPLFDSVDTVKLAIEGLTAMVSTMTLNKERMLRGVYSNFSTATDIADYLAQKGVPFRESHAIVGQIVRHCEENGKDFFTLGLDELKPFSPAIEADIAEYIKPESSTERKQSMGSTARAEVERQIAVLKERFGF
ncbi:MAG: argininosuccinate lyase [Spirochaetia bacterium]|jgi:argininosuccinate lyase|nr:argininosuccinate lyase [Spirochaetia bacterium]